MLKELSLEINLSFNLVEVKTHQVPSVGLSTTSYCSNHAIVVIGSPPHSIHRGLKPFVNLKYNFFSFFALHLVHALIEVPPASPQAHGSRDKKRKNHYN